MKVEAVKLGYYNNRRIYPGEVFELKDPKDFSDSQGLKYQGWMKKVPETVAVSEEKGKTTAANFYSKKKKSYQSANDEVI